jgi:hypothetical protein
MRPSILGFHRHPLTWLGWLGGQTALKLLRGLPAIFARASWLLVYSCVAALNVLKESSCVERRLERHHLPCAQEFESVHIDLHKPCTLTIVHCPAKTFPFIWVIC